MFTKEFKGTSMMKLLEEDGAVGVADVGRRASNCWLWSSVIGKGIFEIEDGILDYIEVDIHVTYNTYQP